jgi:anti-sigma regulatory factor (Ser/Thr protein kinase)
MVEPRPARDSTIEVAAMTGIDRSSSGTRSVADAGARLEMAYPPRDASAGQMRRALRAYLSERALDATVVYDVVLAADEAFINAVGHAEAADDVIRVTARVSEGEASVEIRDGGGGFAYRRSDRPSAPDVLRPNGRGVFLMESLMDEVSVDSGSTGTTVRMVRRIA